MDKFLEKYNFPILNQEEMENLNRLIKKTKGRIKSTKLEMKMERSQQTTQKYKGS